MTSPRLWCVVWCVADVCLWFVLVCFSEQKTRTVKEYNWSQSWSQIPGSDTHTHSTHRHYQSCNMTVYISHEYAEISHLTSLMPSLEHILSIAASSSCVSLLLFHSFMCSSYLNLVTTKGKAVNVNLPLRYCTLLTFFVAFGEEAQTLLAYRCSVWLSHTTSHP